MPLAPNESISQTMIGSSNTLKMSSDNDLIEPTITDISFKEPLNLNMTLSSGQTFRWEKKESGWWTGIINDSRVLLRQKTLNGASHQLECKMASPEKANTVIKNYFKDDTNYKNIYNNFNKDPVLKLAAEKYNGLRLLSQEPWEMLISFILSSASNIPRIKGNIKRLCEEFGILKSDFYGEYHTFPTAQSLSSASINDFKKLGFGFRAKYVWETSSKVAESSGFLDETGKLSYFDARKELCDLSGVGEKVADCVLLFGYDRLESFPVDTWIKKIIEKYYFNGKSIATKKLAEFGRDKFGIYAGIAQQYLFEYARGLEAE